MAEKKAPNPDSSPAADMPPGGPPRRRRKLAAIMMADVTGYSRMMGEDEDRTIRLIKAFHEQVQLAVGEFEGRVVNTAGDSVLGEFDSVVHAVQCAQRIQAQLRTHNAEQAAAEQIHVRIGIHLRDIVQGDGPFPVAPEGRKRIAQGVSLGTLG